MTSITKLLIDNYIVLTIILEYVNTRSIMYKEIGMFKSIENPQKN